MKYKVKQTFARKPREIYLEVWVNPDGSVSLAIGNWLSYSRLRKTGHSLPIGDTIVNTYLPNGAPNDTLELSVSSFAAHTFISGKYNVVKVDFRD